MRPYVTMYAVRKTDASPWNENVFSYNVSGMEELPGTALEEMEAGEWDLTLFTCTASGKNRVTVRCDKIG